MKLMHGYMDRGLGRGTHAICTEEGEPLEMTDENVERIVQLWNYADTSKEELVERNRMLSDIAMSAVALKLNIDHGFIPRLDALNRDLRAFQQRFGGVVNGGHEDTGKPDHKRSGRKLHRV